MTFDVIALVCALGQSPSECQPPTALRQIFLGNVRNELMCAIEGQQHLAQAASMVPDGYRVKLICTRHEDEKL
jgi:hypothetical protein